MQQPNLYALNVGRGDCFFLELPDQEGARIVMIDGGDRLADGRGGPVRFVREKGWNEIDLMILTHLHPDHLMGLLDIADRYPVREAVLPYPEFSVSLGTMGHPKAAQTGELFRAYGELLQLLKRQRTRLHWRPPFGKRAVWRFGEYALRHLDPLDKEHLPAYGKIERLLAGAWAPEEQERLCAAFDGLSNGDSSVWLLEKAGADQLVLFGADAGMPNWERVTSRERLRPRGLKVAHHGMPDGWNEQLLRDLSPEWVLVTNDEAEYHLFKDRWEQLASSSGSRLVVTGSHPGTDYLAAKLPSVPVRMEFA